MPEPGRESGTDRETTGIDVTGFAVEALDGTIGKVDEATRRAGGGGIVVDTGPWIFGKRVMIPASLVDRVDADEERVYVALRRDEIKNAPEYGL
ncbi:MAG: hypothetical protein M3M94_03740 [Actinomycetota bacterium]|nr:hypothetical protein [Actinomycetota bacterium]